MSDTTKVYFQGLNALRFFAASLVLLTHIPFNQMSVGLPHLPLWAFFTKGSEGVSFFFTLSGFLITYLLLKEQASTQQINLKYFYWRRCLRIWPLYFLIVIFGLFFYAVIVPGVGMEHGSDYPLSTAIPLYLLFLPHLVNSLYKVGGILHVTWSVGVEEQFYLMWAPIVKRFYDRLHQVCLFLIVFFFALNIINFYVILDLNYMLMKFLSHLRFHFMFVGGLAAYYLFHHRSKVVQLSIFKYPLLRLLILASLLLYLGTIHIRSVHTSVMVQFPLAFLYIWLIIDVILHPQQYHLLEHRSLNWLGKISYGIYMYHMIAIYAASFLFLKVFSGIQHYFLIYTLLYYVFVFGATIFMAHLSYEYFEKRFLKLKRW